MMRIKHCFCSLVLLASWNAADAQPSSHDYEGTVSSGVEFPKPACPVGTQSVITPAMPDKGLAEDGTTTVFYRDTANGGVIHLQTRNGTGAWRELANIPVHYTVECHP